MLRAALVLCSLFVVSLGCGESTVGGGENDSGGVDSGTRVDSGVRTDSGSGVDSGGRLDGGTLVDSGLGRDGGFGFDLGGARDGGFGIDLGGPRDGGFSFDANLPFDLGATDGGAAICATLRPCCASLPRRPQALCISAADTNNSDACMRFIEGLRMMGRCL